MEFVSLDTVVKEIYDNRVSFIRNKNIELEREYFTENSDCIPMSEIMQGASYEDHFASFKSIIKNKNDEDIDQIFMLLEDYFLFSYGHDMMFKMKLKADIFTSVPIDELIYPMLLENIKEKYNNVSIMEENPNLESNIKGIDKIIYTYTELQSLLYLLYCNDFHFPNGWEGICPDTYEDVLAILNKTGMTIGDFLHALIDFKCKIMSEIFEKIEDKNLKVKYLDKVKKIKDEKHKETKTFSHVNLPITYFKDHTFSDFLHIKHNSTILENDNSKQIKKIILPHN